VAIKEQDSSEIFLRREKGGRRAASIPRSGESLNLCTLGPRNPAVAASEVQTSRARRDACERKRSNLLAWLRCIRLRRRLPSARQRSYGVVVRTRLLIFVGRNGERFTSTDDGSDPFRRAAVY